MCDIRAQENNSPLPAPVREPNDSFGNQTGRTSDSSKTTEAKRHDS